MKKIALLLFLSIHMLYLNAQITRQTKPKTIKKDSLTRSSTLQKTEATVYSLYSAKVTVRTGNDNKEHPSRCLLYISEADGILGKGTELFYDQNQLQNTQELRVNSEYVFPMAKSQNATAEKYTLDNLQSKGLTFTIFYFPNFFADAWKIDQVTITFEFRDQLGQLHSTYGSLAIPFITTNGLLTNTKRVMRGTVNGFFQGQQISITDK